MDAAANIKELYEDKDGFVLWSNLAYITDTQHSVIYTAINFTHTQHNTTSL